MRTRVRMYTHTLGRTMGRSAAQPAGQRCDVPFSSHFAAHRRQQTWPHWREMGSYSSSRHTGHAASVRQKNKPKGKKRGFSLRPRHRADTTRRPPPLAGELHTNCTILECPSPALPSREREEGTPTWWDVPESSAVLAARLSAERGGGGGGTVSPVLLTPADAAAAAPSVPPVAGSVARRRRSQVNIWPDRTGPESNDRVGGG